jgi:hypothetical protein
MSKPSVPAYPKSNVPSSPKSVGATVTSISGAVPLQDQVRQRAHQLFESRGRQDGKAEQDWLSAEREILNKRRQ